MAACHVLIPEYCSNAPHPSYLHGPGLSTFLALPDSLRVGTILVQRIVSRTGRAKSTVWSDRPGSQAAISDAGDVPQQCHTTLMGQVTSRTSPMLSGSGGGGRGGGDLTSCRLHFLVWLVGGRWDPFACFWAVSLTIIGSVSGPGQGFRLPVCGRSSSVLGLS